MRIWHTWAIIISMQVCVFIGCLIIVEFLAEQLFWMATST
jgi:hypothetical protein